MLDMSVTALKSPSSSCATNRSHQKHSYSEANYFAARKPLLQ